PAESFHSQADDEVMANCDLSSCFPFSNCSPPSMRETLLLLPSPPLLKNLVEKFFGSQLPFTRVVHYQTFIKEFQIFQQSPADAKPAWVALLFTMLSCALMSCSPSTFASMNDNAELTHEQTGRKFQQ